MCTTLRNWMRPGGRSRRLRCAALYREDTFFVLFLFDSTVRDTIISLPLATRRGKC